MQNNDCKKVTTSVELSTAGIRQQLTRRTASSTACPVAAKLLQDEHASIVDLSMADDARSLPIREFLAFERAQAARLEHEECCDRCQQEISGRAA